MFDNVFRHKIQNFSERIVIGKRRLVFGDFPKLPIQSLDDVSRIYYLADFGRICKKRRKNIPILLPASHAAGIRFCPIFLELNQCISCFIFVDCLINLFEISHNCFDVFVTHIFRRRTDLMNNATLNLRMRERSIDCFSETVQTRFVICRRRSRIFQ